MSDNDQNPGVTEAETAKGTDAELLQRFIEQQDQVALSQLVNKYSALVMSVCVQMLRNRHDAEDAFQAVFIKLVRKADTIQNRELLASWLYRVSHREASQFLRQQKKQVSVLLGEETALIDSNKQDAQAEDQFQELHEEVNRLPEEVRGPIVLCYLNGMTRKEAAAELNTTDGVVKSRLSNGRELLRKRLLKRGIALTSVMAAWQASQTQAANWATSDMVQKTVEECLLQTVSGDGAVISSNSMLSQGDQVMPAVSSTSVGAIVGGVFLFAGGLMTGLAISPQGDENAPVVEQNAEMDNQGGLAGEVNGDVAGAATSPSQTEETFSGRGNPAAANSSGQPRGRGRGFGGGGFGAGSTAPLGGAVRGSN